ncbi:MAG TPA: penicillin-insensitive murein endopeptidase [Stellaceae bacterium]|nr:penicillin-insensitive murein endopeptidase [Stellaceae bacterium]
MHRIAAIALCAGVLILLCGGAPRAQQNAAEETAREEAALATLPGNAAQVLFGRQTAPAPGPPEAIGGYARGCLQGAVALPADGPNWQVMRPSRHRAFGHPALIRLIERLAALAPQQAGWPGLLIGDIAQPRGGPMLSGHGSHQIGLDADIWLTPMPARRLSPEERDTMRAEVVVADRAHVNAALWTGAYRRLLETAARLPQVTRIFVNLAIKRELCREAGPDRLWLAKIRPWWGHVRHFHLRIACPAGDRECRDQPPPPPGDGCGAELAWWLHHAPPPPRPPRPLPLSALPQACAALVGKG